MGRHDGSQPAVDTSGGSAPDAVATKLIEMALQGVQVFSAHGGPGSSDNGVERHIVDVPSASAMPTTLAAYCNAILAVAGMQIPGDGPACQTCWERVLV